MTEIEFKTQMLEYMINYYKAIHNVDYVEAVKWKDLVDNLLQEYVGFKEITGENKEIR